MNNDSVKAAEVECIGQSLSDMREVTEKLNASIENLVQKIKPSLVESISKEETANREYNKDSLSEIEVIVKDNNNKINDMIDRVNGIIRICRL